MGFSKSLVAQWVGWCASGVGPWICWSKFNFMELKLLGFKGLCMLRIVDTLPVEVSIKIRLQSSASVFETTKTLNECWCFVWLGFVFVDHVPFGEVAMAPPSFNTKPKKAQVKSPVSCTAVLSMLSMPACCRLCQSFITCSPFSSSVL